MGRNVPMYHFTGAEDIIQFNVSWYCNDPENPEEVINKCRLLETASERISFRTPVWIRSVWFSITASIVSNILEILSPVFAADEIKSADDLEGKKIGVQLGTTGDADATEVKDATVERYNKEGHYSTKTH